MFLLWIKFLNIFFTAINSIKNRLAQNLRININETLMLFSGFLTEQIRDKKSVSEIRENLSKMLTHKKVMIGVPESMRKVSFEAQIDDIPLISISLVTPIPIMDYILTSES